MTLQGPQLQNFSVYYTLIYVYAFLKKISIIMFIIIHENGSNGKDTVGK